MTRDVNRTELAQLLTRLARPAVGSWIKIPAVDSVELLALADYDFAVVDLEHSVISLETASLQIGFALGSGLAPLVRVPSISDPAANRLLDAGAHGIIFPHVDSVEDAMRAAAAIRFPPRGVRGVAGTTRFGGWGAVPRDEFMARGRELPSCIVQIESAAAVAAVDDIAAVEGVDMLFIGAVDLAAELGCDDSDREVQSRIREVLEAARRAGKPVGASFGTAAHLPEWVGRVDLLVMGNDAGFLRTAATRERLELAARLSEA